MNYWGEDRKPLKNKTKDNDKKSLLPSFFKSNSNNNNKLLKKGAKPELFAYIHGDSVGIESSGGGIVLETTEEVVVPDGIELGVALEGVDRTLGLNGIGALCVVVIR